jgi:hypothetical protein
MSPCQLASAPEIVTRSRLSSPTTTLAGSATLETTSCRLLAEARATFGTARALGATRRWPFRAAAGTVGAKTRGRLDASPTARTLSPSSAAVGVKVTRAVPVSSVRAAFEASTPWPVTSSCTSGTPTPAAETTRAVAAAALPTTSPRGTRSSTR